MNKMMLNFYSTIFLPSITNNAFMGKLHSNNKT